MGIESVTPNTESDGARKESIAALQRTLTPEAWTLFESLSDPISQDEFAERMKEFNALGAEQLAENKPDPEESLAEREQTGVKLNFPGGRTVTLSRSMRGVFTLEA